MKNKLYIISFTTILVIIILIAIAFALNDKKKFESNNSAKASNSNKQITTTNDWNSGENLNINTDNGNINILNNSIEASPKHTISSSMVSANYDSVSKDNIIDGNTSTYWSDNYSGSVSLNEHFVLIDANSAINVKKLRIARLCWEISVDYSNNNLDWTNAYYEASSATGSYYTATLSQTISARYWRIKISGTSPQSNKLLYEFELFPPDPSSATATHTTAPSQIDGTSDFYEWEEFTPTQSVPANTTVGYRFRTSPDYSSWTSWTDSQTYSGTPLDLTTLVTSRATVGETTTYYRYLQIETTLTSSDGVANPSISDYTIDYHTNLKPNKPTAQTAVVGE